MSKVHITTKSGMRLTIEGTPDEVAATVALIEGGPAVRESEARRKKREQAPVERKGKSKAGPVSLIAELIDGGYFKKPKELSAIKMTLEEQGHFYPVTTLSPILLRLVRKRDLRRIKEKNRWLYVG